MKRLVSRGVVSTLLLLVVVTRATAPVEAGLSQRFDGIPVVIPGTNVQGFLLARWNSNASSASAQFQVTPTAADTPPHSAFATGAISNSDAALVSPTLSISGQIVVSFRHRFQLEAGSNGVQVVAFDGAVLEISVDDGPFTDVFASFGTLVPGTQGYTHTMDTLLGGPLPGRPAWSGSSGGFVTTRVVLQGGPSFHADSKFQLRWRLVSDVSVPSVGWWVDSVSITGVRAFLTPSFDFDDDHQDDILVAPGAGGGPHVRVLSGATGQPILDFFAYDPSFTGGVYVAACDLDDDGVPDIITGAGLGGGPHVQVFSGATGALLAHPLASFFAFAPAFTGGVRVSCADINGDGRPGVIVAAGPGGGPHVRVLSGVDGSELASLFTYAPTFLGGVFVGP